MRLQGRLPLYERLLGAVIDDVTAGGHCAELLADPGPDPIGDAVPLRLMGAVHRLVLQGDAPELEPFYASVGGSFDPATDRDPVPAFLGTIKAHRDEVERGLSQPVQTNEVARCRALMLAFLEVARCTGLPLRMLEIGSSAGLHLRWDRYRYGGGADDTAFGPVNSPVRLTGEYRGRAPRLDGIAVVGERRGCDASPLDPASADGQLTLKSFIWPEQTDRLARLDAALQLAPRVPARVDRADAAQWVDDQLSEDAGAAGMATVVFHSIVWQYLPPRTRGRLLATFHRGGRAATDGSPLAWVRMEPAGGDVAAPATEILMTLWPGGTERLIARAGYHGQWVEALSGGSES